MYLIPLKQLYKEFLAKHLNLEFILSKVCLNMNSLQSCDGCSILASEVFGNPLNKLKFCIISRNKHGTLFASLLL